MGDTSDTVNVYNEENMMTMLKNEINTLMCVLSSITTYQFQTSCTNIIQLIRSPPKCVCLYSLNPSSSSSLELITKGPRSAMGSLRGFPGGGGNDEQLSDEVEEWCKK